MMSASGAISSVHELLKLEDHVFIEAAHWMVVGERPNLRRVVECQKWLDGGRSKLFVLRQLTESSKAQEKAVDDSLAQLLRRYAKANARGWVGWYYREMLQVESDFPDDVMVRRLARHVQATSVVLQPPDPAVKDLQSEQPHEAGATLSLAPLISIVLLIGDGPAAWTLRAIESILSQSHARWQLVLCGGPMDPALTLALADYERSNDRVTVHRSSNSAAAANQALANVRASHVILMRDHDMLEPHALHQLSSLIEEKFPDLVYSDAIAVSSSTEEVLRPILRPAYSLELHRALSYLGTVICFRTQVLRDLKGLDEKLATLQLEDLIFRASERAPHIVHIAHGLYRHRTLQAPADEGMQAGMEEAARKLVLAHLARCGEAAEVHHGQHHVLEIAYVRNAESKVAVIIPTKDHGEMVRKCVESLERTIGEVKYDIYVVDHESTEPASRRILEELDRKHHVLRYRGEFNFSAINNWAVRQLAGPYTHYLFCNNDIEAFNHGWLERMLALGEKEDVAIVGAKLLYPDRVTIQHAGVCIGMNGLAGHYGHFVEANSDAAIMSGVNSCFGGLHATREMSAVTAACMLVRSEAFTRCAGFDQELVVGFGDVDLCLRATQFGYRVLYCAQAELIHAESMSRGTTPGRDPHPEDTRYFANRWRKMIEEGDPYFSPSFSRFSRVWEIEGQVRGCDDRSQPVRSRSVRKLVGASSNV